MQSPFNSTSDAMCVVFLLLLAEVQAALDGEFKALTAQVKAYCREKEHKNKSGCGCQRLLEASGGLGPGDQVQRMRFEISNVLVRI